MKELTKEFSINEISEVKTENSDEFAICRIAVLSTRRNSHKVIITDEILRRDGLSVLGKWIVCDFNGFDATTHTPNEIIVGIIPKDANYEFVETDDGNTILYVDGIISKLYATKVYNMFKSNNKRNVSVEMLTANDTELPNGDILIDGLKIVGITILGSSVNGSCPDANLTITKFSAHDAEKYYTEISKKDKAIKLANDLMEFANSLNDIKDKEGEPMDLENKELSESTEENDIVMSETENIEEKEMVSDTPQNEDDTNEKDTANDKDAENSDDVVEESEEEKEMACGENDKEMSEDTESEPKEEEKVFSLKEHVDDNIYAESSDEIKEFANKFIEMNANEILETAIRLFSENSELLTEKAKIEDEKREKKFSAIMASVKGDLDEKTFAELVEEGKTIALDALGAFENKVKAFAYEATKNRKPNNEESDDIMLFGSNDNIDNINDLDVFERISKM